LINIDEQFILKWLGDPNIVSRVIIFTIYKSNICTVVTNKIHDVLFFGLHSATRSRLNKSSTRRFLSVQWTQNVGPTSVYFTLCTTLTRLTERIPMTAHTACLQRIQHAYSAYSMPTAHTTCLQRIQHAYSAYSMPTTNL